MLKAILLISVSLLTVACNKDQQYYIDNPEDAKAKMEECFGLVLQGKGKEAENNQECDNADKALKVLKKQQREAAEKAKKERISRGELTPLEKFEKNAQQIKIKGLN